MGADASKGTVKQGGSDPRPISAPTEALPNPVIQGADASTLLSKEAIGQLCRAMPSAHGDRWTLLFCTDLHGKSFSRFLHHCLNRGPTVVILQERSSGKVFGGYCPVDWRTPADRHEEARDERASVARAERTGCPTGVLRNRPENQHMAFYGPPECFVFAVGKVDETEVDVQVYRSRPHVNSNFMYLFDVHAHEDKIGVGMGGQVGYHAWFLDRGLEKGHCKGAVNTTFGNPRLSAEDVFEIEVVEVWGVDSKCESVDMELRQQGGRPKEKSKHILDDEDNADKAIMRMNGVQFHSDGGADRSCS